MSSFKSILNIILFGGPSKRFLFAAIASFGFSIAVILSTIGLMDGYVKTLKTGLRNVYGEIKIIHQNGFFDTSKLTQALMPFEKEYSIEFSLRTEGFLISNGDSKGVIINGSQSLKANEIILGKKLAEHYKLEANNRVVLAFPNGSKNFKNLPVLRPFFLQGVKNHGLYEKDMRMVYINDDLLSGLITSGNNKNLVMMSSKGKKSSEDIEIDILRLASILPPEFKALPFWNEFGGLIEAVKIEKFSITIILQLIVIVAIFNILAFMLYITEKKNKEFFLIRAMGCSKRDLLLFWFKLNSLIWIFSSLLGITLTHIFNFLLGYLDFFEIPGDIYILTRLSLDLTFKDYIIVLAAAGIWILFISLLGSSRITRKSVIGGLKQEYN